MHQQIRAIALAWTVLMSTGAEAVETWHPSDAEIALLVRNSDAKWTGLFGGGRLRDHSSWDDLAVFTLNSLAVDYDKGRVATAIDALAALQDTEPTSQTYGNVRWYSGDAKVVDRNGVEFTTRHMALAWLLYRDRLTEGERRAVYRLLDLARTGIERHRVSIAYTNIFLMKSWNLIALGQIFGDSRLKDLGVDQLRDWLARAERSGIEEYLSPTYSAVDLENLALIENLAADPQVRSLARQGLDRLWTDLAIHWYVPGDRLGGPHSRDYDRLVNRGGIDDLAARAGWSQRGKVSPGPYAAYTFAPPPPAAAAWLSAPLPRFVTERVGESEALRISSYVGRGLYVGSAEAGYGAHDNTLVVNLGSGATIPTISAFMDGRRDHYGLNRTLEAGSGHMKALHLKPFIASVQNGPEVLYLTSAKDTAPELSALETTVILPADADYWVDGRRLDFNHSVSKWWSDPKEIGDGTSFEIATAPDGRVEARISDQSETAGIGISQRLPVAAGDRIVVSADLAGGPAALYLNFEEADGHLIGGENIKPVKPAADAFNRFDFGASAPASAVRCKAWLYSSIAGKTELRVRDLTVEVTRVGLKVPDRVAFFDFRPKRAEDLTVPTGSTLVVRRGPAAVAIRPLGAWDVGGASVAFHLINDGLEHGAVRLTAMHAEAKTDGRGTAALWVLGGDGLIDEAAFQAFIHRAEAVKASVTRNGSIFDLRSSGPTGALRVAADVETSKRLAHEGAPAVDPKAVTTVNGVSP